jgi:hypothetical protein
MRNPNKKDQLRDDTWGFPISGNPKNHMSYIMVEGSLEVKLPTIWTDEKQRRAEAERRGRLEERRSEEKE